MVTVEILGVSDPDDDEVVLTVSGVTQDEPVNRLGDGDTSPDAVIHGSLVLIRAERAADGNGRVYELSFSADDGSGGVLSGTVSVSVLHDRQSSVCVDDGQLFDSLQP